MPEAFVCPRTDLLCSTPSRACPIDSALFLPNYSAQLCDLTATSIQTVFSCSFRKSLISETVVSSASGYWVPSFRPSGRTESNCCKDISNLAAHVSIWESTEFCRRIIPVKVCRNRTGAHKICVSLFLYEAVYIPFLCFFARRIFRTLRSSVCVRTELRRGCSAYR